MISLFGNQTFILAYEHWKFKKTIRDALNGTHDSFELDPENPLIDLIDPISGKFGTPNEIREHYKINRIYFTNRKRTFFGYFEYIENKNIWKLF